MYVAVTCNHDGSICYVSGTLAPIVTELASESPESHDVRCCGGVYGNTTTTTCGNGISCTNICGSKNSGIDLSAFLPLSLLSIQGVWPWSVRSVTPLQQSTRFVTSRCRRSSGVLMLRLYKVWKSLRILILIVLFYRNHQPMWNPEKEKIPPNLQSSLGYHNLDNQHQLLPWEMSPQDQPPPHEIVLLTPVHQKNCCWCS